MNFLSLMAVGAFIFIVAPFLTVMIPAALSGLGGGGILLGMVIAFALLMKIGGML